MTDLSTTPKTRPGTSGQRVTPDIEELVERYFHAQEALPPPEFLAKYDEIMPGAAKRILKMAEEHNKTANRLAQKLAAQEHWSGWGLIATCTAAIGLLMTGLLITLRDTHAGDVLSLFAPAAVGAAGAVISIVVAAYYSRRGYGGRA